LKFAVKRTWPETPREWEYHGEADGAKAFALRFAETHRLAEAIELVVIEDEGDEDDRATRFYRVVGTDPYSLKPAEPRPINPSAPGSRTAQQPMPSEPAAAGAAAHQAGTRSALEGPGGEKDDRAVDVTDLRPFGTFFLYSAKILAIFVAVILLVRLIRWYFIG
jgi:hypothetical protein